MLNERDMAECYRSIAIVLLKGGVQFSEPAPIHLVCDLKRLIGNFQPRLASITLFRSDAGTSIHSLIFLLIIPLW